MTKEELTQLKEKRIGVIKQMRELNDKAVGEKRSFSAEENEQYTRMSKDERDLKSQIDAEERAQQLKEFDTEKPVSNEPDSRSGKEDTEKRAFSNYLATGEKRDISVGTNGGALAPQQFTTDLIAEVEKATPLLAKIKTIMLSKAGSLGAAEEEADASDADWTSEVPASVAADSTLKYKKRELSPNALLKIIKVSDKLIKASALPVDSIVRQKLAAKIADAFENAICNGTGTDQPLGLFTKSDAGIGASRDVVGKNTTTVITADSFVMTKMKLRAQYRKNATWILSTDILTDALLLKDSNGQYIYRTGLVAGEPDRLLNAEVIESEFAPSTKAAGSYVAVFGDLSYYWWALLDQIEIIVLKELYAEKNLIGYKGLAYADGQPVLAAAFARMAMASA